MYIYIYMIHFYVLLQTLIIMEQRVEKIKKLCEKMFHHLNKSQTNFECFRLFCS